MRACCRAGHCLLLGLLSCLALLGDDAVAAWLAGVERSVDPAVGAEMGEPRALLFLEIRSVHHTRCLLENQLRAVLGAMLGSDPWFS